MKVLITGGAGFIGSHLAEHLQQRADVRILDDLRTGHRENLSGLNVEFVRGSILDRKVVRSAMEGVDYVYHLAAMVSVPESIRYPHACVKLNVIGLLNVLEAASLAEVRKLCFGSSAAVYGDNNVVPKEECMCPEPRSPYAMTKLDGEFYCRQFTERGLLETVALRFFNVFGPRQDPAAAYAAAIPIFFKSALNGKSLTIFGDGGQSRDFIYVKDVVSALEFVAQKPGLNGVFNVGSGYAVTILELARRIIELTGSSSAMEFASPRGGDIRQSVASIKALRSEGFCPAITLGDGLQRTLASHFPLGHHPSRIQAVSQGAKEQCGGPDSGP
jgi:UDP-glucose 4-epimerase